jgi:type VI secretion system secreted protein Hcp
LKVPGIQGDSTAAGHEGEIGIESFSWGAGGGAGTPQVQDLHVLMPVNKASPALLQADAQGRHFSPVVVSVAGPSGQDFLTFTLSDALVSSFQTRDLGDGVPHDDVGFRFGRLTEEFVPQDDSGAPGTPVKGTFNAARRGVTHTPGTDLLADVPASQPSTQMFLKVPGIPGDVTAAGHEGEIAVESFGWGESQGRSHGSGGGAGKVAVQDFHVVLKADKSAPLLMQAVTSGELFRDVSLAVRKAGGEQQTDFLTYNLRDAVITSFQTLDANDGIPRVEVTFRFAHVTEAFLPQSDDGSLGSPVTGGFDGGELRGVHATRGKSLLGL